MSPDEFGTFLRAGALGCALILILIGTCATGRGDYSNHTVVAFVMGFGLSILAQVSKDRVK